MKVVIIGGGFCGSTVAKILDTQKNIDVTIIDKKKYFEYYPGLPTTLKNPKQKSKIKKNFKDFLKNSKIINDEVTDVNNKYISTKKTGKFYFDKLVISTGIEYPIYLENKKNVYTLTNIEQIEKINNSLKKAKDVLIIGGGLIGVETAGELSDKTPDIKITIIHPHDRLIERNPKHVSKTAENILKKKSVQIIFDEKIIKKENNTYISNKKNNYTFDLSIWCAGIKLNPFFMKNFDKQIFNDKQALRVNKYLQLLNHKNIFVGGDITNLSEEKTGFNAERHGRLIAENIIRLKNKKKLKNYKILKTPLVIGLGKYNAVFVYKNFILPGFLAAFLKKFVEKWTLFQLS
jgi:apoptosis-inducing factor 2